MDDTVATGNTYEEEGEEEHASQERAKAAPRKRNARGQPVGVGDAPLHVDLATLLASGGACKGGVLLAGRAQAGRAAGWAKTG